MECILDVKKNASTSYVIIGEIIIYTIQVKNISQEIVENVVVKDLLPEELKFILGSIEINENKDTSSNIISGVSLDIIMPNETKIITFETKVIKKINTIIENKAVVEFKYKNKDMINCNYCSSNINIVYIRNPDISIIKVCDKQNVQIEDEITYTITIENNGDLDGYNVFLIDKIPSSLQVIEGTFSIDNQIVNSVEIEKGVMLDNLEVGDIKTIKYKAKVISSGHNGKIENKAKVRFSYTLPSGITKYKESSEYNTCVYMAISNFKQISLDEYLTIPNKNPDIEEINNVKANVKINRCNIIQTSIGRSSEGQILSGYKLVIHGSIDQVMEYIAKEPAQPVHSASFKIPFSSYIVLPKDFTIGSDVKVEATVEDIFHRRMNERSFFNNFLILLIAKVNC